MSNPTAVDAPETGASKTVESFLRREAPALLAYFERRVPYSDAPDLFGETLLVIWRRVDSLPVDEHEARMWLYGVARRVLSSNRRGNIRRQALVQRLRDEAAADPSPAKPNDSELEAALATLSPLDAEIIRLLHWDGFTLAEIAQHLGRPPGTIRSRYSRARALLRSALHPVAKNEPLELGVAGGDTHPNSGLNAD